MEPILGIQARGLNKCLITEMAQMRLVRVLHELCKNEKLGVCFKGGKGNIKNITRTHESIHVLINVYSSSMCIHEVYILFASKKM